MKKCETNTQAGRFLEKYGQLELFPVKLQVPLLMTVHIVMLSKCVHDSAASSQLQAIMHRTTVFASSRWQACPKLSPDRGALVLCAVCPCGLC